MFRVTTLDLQDPPRRDGLVDNSEDFFGQPTYLTVSGQLEAEIFALALSDVYSFGPTFRAENSNTSRHLAEFWMVEPEVAFCDLDGLAELAEDFLKHIFSQALDQCPEDMAFFNRWYDTSAIETLEGIINSSFERMTYTEAVRLLESSGESFEFPVSWGLDLQSEHERYITEKRVGRPVVVTDYPRDIKAFYMRLNDDGETVRAMDVLVPRIGEIIGGSQREEREDVLLERSETVRAGRGELLVVPGPAALRHRPPRRLRPGPSSAPCSSPRACRTSATSSHSRERPRTWSFRGQFLTGQPISISTTCPGSIESTASAIS